MELSALGSPWSYSYPRCYIELTWCQAEVQVWGPQGILSSQGTQLGNTNCDPCESHRLIPP